MLNRLRLLRSRTPAAPAATGGVVRQGNPTAPSLPLFLSCGPGLAKSYSGLHLILSTLSGIPYTSGEVSVLACLERLLRFPLP
ncbi:hypothetical protein EMIT0194MI4_90136 [Pseudomonas sp. IT-194MI4]